MIQDLLIPFLAVGFAELLDKSQLSLLLLAAKTKKPLLLLTGAFLGFLIVDGLAVVLGSWVTGVVPDTILRLVSGLLFILFGILSLRSLTQKPDAKTKARSPFLSGLFAILLVEWGDKTQLATALFSTQYNPLLVFIGVMIALFLLSALAIFLGKLLATSLDKRKINLLSGIVFIGIGLYILFF